MNLPKRTLIAAALTLAACIPATASPSSPAIREALFLQPQSSVLDTATPSTGSAGDDAGNPATACLQALGREIPR